MKYKRASDILPDELLREVQKYIAGEALYIPKDAERRKWGENTGAKHFFTQRNAEIRNKFFHKMTLENLADEYNLSVDTIRKIVYR
ncbi:MAG: CD3324 family protein [Clostridiaceae bacterium]|nr:CD3324 family protein [Clostridiaceae bacterium]